MILCHLNAGGRLVGASGIGVGNAIARDIRLLEMLKVIPIRYIESKVGGVTGTAKDPPARIDLTALAEELTALEPGPAIWAFDGVGMIAPALHLVGAGLLAWAAWIVSS